MRAVIQWSTLIAVMLGLFVGGAVWWVYNLVRAAPEQPRRRPEGEVRMRPHKAVLFHPQTNLRVQLKGVSGPDRIAIVSVHDGPREGLVYQCPLLELQNVGVSK